MSATETFDLPECYDGPVLIQKDSSDINMCYYDEDMVQIHDMKQTEVTIGINNVWVTSTLPEELRVFEHGADGLQCLDNEGEDVDVTSGESKLTVQCYQENEDDPLSPFLAVIDVVITDSIICGSNSVAHPCYSDDQEILESCSWRIVIPCCPTTMCTDNPTDTPTASPSKSPTNSPSSSPINTPTDTPTDSPSKSPTNSPSSSPTDEKEQTDVPTIPTIVVDQFGIDDSTEDDTFITPSSLCPEDIQLIKQDGVMEYPSDTVTIISQDSSTVTVSLTQTLTASDTDIDYIFYQYQVDTFNMQCYEEDSIAGGEIINEITIDCTESSQTALLQFWVADNIDKGVLSESDDAEIPRCCYPDGVPQGTPVTEYLIEISCVSVCVELEEEFIMSSPVMEEITTSLPMDEITTSPPMDEITTSPPSAVDEITTFLPMDEITTSPPMEEFTPPSMMEEYTPSSAMEAPTSSPTGDAMEVESMEEFTTGSPMEEFTTYSPTGDAMGVESEEEFTTGSPMEEFTTSPPTGDAVESSPS